MRRHTVLGDPESTNAIGSSNLGNNLSSFSREVSTEREHEGSRMGRGMGASRSKIPSITTNSKSLTLIILFTQSIESRLERSIAAGGTG